MRGAGATAGRLGGGRSAAGRRPGGVRCGTIAALAIALLAACGGNGAAAGTTPAASAAASAPAAPSATTSSATASTTTPTTSGTATGSSSSTTSASAARTIGSSSAASGARGTQTGAGVGSGPVSVLYAGSLVNIMERDLGPAFATATGYTYQGYGAGSSAIANQIKGTVRHGDVFISASPQVNATLMGQANGSWVSWYVTFMQAPLVIGYNPNSAFVSDLKSKPWYDVITEAGFRIGCTDPKLDPKGQLTVQALQQAATRENQPDLPARVCTTNQVFPEEELVGRLQAGQLDAGFFYANEAEEQHIPTIGLGPIDLKAQYTITVLNKAADEAGAIAFVRFVLGAPGTTILERHGLTILAPFHVSGDATAVPSDLRSALGGP